ncbi:histidine phosphatase family protein [Streptomyces sp. NBC_01176]|uniref:histidine phosphatase family protein n=1 Tax=Streptomyces sp. NBC_01176 TaxID=2903760 RepID=UPI0038686D3F|nr:histidine phosphatase family protein [Streptomyces sp. NBC_01176]
MTSRVILISAAIGAALREARFDEGGRVEAAGLRLARAAAGAVPGAERLWVSPSVRCRETADALGLDAVLDVPELAGLDVGRWRGATLEEVSSKEPEAVARWLADPRAAPHGGESVRAFCDRVAGCLDTAAQVTGRTVAVVEPEVVRALVVRVLGAPESAFWRVDVPPLTATEFSGRSGRWNVRVGRPLAPSTEAAGSDG